MGADIKVPEVFWPNKTKTINSTKMTEKEILDFVNQELATVLEKYIGECVSPQTKLLMASEIDATASFLRDSNTIHDYQVQIEDNNTILLKIKPTWVSQFIQIDIVLNQWGTHTKSIESLKEFKNAYPERIAKKGSQLEFEFVQRLKV